MHHHTTTESQLCTQELTMGRQSLKWDNWTLYDLSGQYCVACKELQCT